ncbi:rap guanine nucleotide exchange factor 4-like isoform X2 [Montipora capricornis]|uniref:rap guanine nucleotide exchange factor 4-like isoform X2 n=1 Tax=Montipora capricornis TaxID=246305 RepID=UPI0035F1013D
MVAEWISCLVKGPVNRTEEDMDIIYSRLKDLKGFERFHSLVLRQLCHYGYYQELEEGITLFRQGDIGCYWYAVLSGTVDVIASGTGKLEDAETICSLGPGKVFGESVIDDTPRHATVVTSEFCELLLVKKKDFRVIWERNKQNFEHLMSTPSVTAEMQVKSDTEPHAGDDSEQHSSLTVYPNENMLVAGIVLRNRMMLNVSPKLICDRKVEKRIEKRCFIGSEAVDWLVKITPLVHGRFHVISMLQALLEEGVITNVNSFECEFKDKDILYRFAVDAWENNRPDDEKYTEEDFDEVVLMLSRSGPDAQLRLALRKRSCDRNSDDLALIYEELVHIKALQHLSTTIKKELSKVIVFESCDNKGTVVFKEGEKGNSWYIIMKGTVNVIVHGKGVVCQLDEGDDFGKLALVNNAVRTATIETAQDCCHFLRIGKDDFNRIFQNVESNTVRLKEHDRDVLVLEKMNGRTLFEQNGNHAPQTYSVMAGTPAKMVEYLLETRMDTTHPLDDNFLNDFLVTFPIFMTTESLCYSLLSNYGRTTSFICGPEASGCTIREHSDSIKKRVVQVTQCWCAISGNLFIEDKTINIFIEDLLRSLEKDKLNIEYKLLQREISKLQERFSNNENVDGSSCPQKGRFQSRRMGVGDIAKSKVQCKPIRGSDLSVFPVFCADHSYTTLALPYKATAQTIVNSAEEHIRLGNDCLLCEVTSSGERIPFNPNEICVTTGLSVNGRLFIVLREHLDSLTPIPEQEGPACSSLAFLETVGSKELAYFISQYDYELFNAVNVYEFIYYFFGKENYNQITANLDLLLRRFNEVQFWVQTQVLLTQQLTKRVYLLKKFIKLAAHCNEHNNWHSFFAIVMGLNSVAVGRLTQTWEKLPRKFRNLYEQFESILEPSRNHRVYRLLLGKVKPPILPFMPLLIKDMTFTNEGNSTYLDDLVNFEKMRMIAATIRLLQYYRSEPFPADSPAAGKSAQEISIFVRNFLVIDNQRTLTQLSHRLQPRKPTCMR